MIDKIEKTNAIKNILTGYLTEENKKIKDIDFILNIIANEIINDNVENLLLNNLITSETFNPNETTKRSTESVLLNIHDIKKWINKFQIKN